MHDQVQWSISLAKIAFCAWSVHHSSSYLQWMMAQADHLWWAAGPTSAYRQPLSSVHTMVSISHTYCSSFLLTFIFFVLLYITHHCSVSGLGYWPPSHHAPFLHCLSLCTQLPLCLFLFSLPSFRRLEVWVYLKLYIQTPSALACLASLLSVELSFHFLPEPLPLFNSHLVQFMWLCCQSSSLIFVQCTSVSHIFRIQ